MKPSDRDDAPAAHDDRRSEARLSPGDVECDIEGARFVHVLGLTLGGRGMRVLTDQHLPRDRPVDVALHLSENETLHFKGLAVWEKDQDLEFTHRYVCGMKFIDPDEASSGRLHSFVEEFLAREHPETS